jgi:hypothetical protein
VTYVTTTTHLVAQASLYISSAWLVKASTLKSSITIIVKKATFSKE